MNITQLKNCQNKEINEVLINIYQIVGLQPASYPVRPALLIEYLQKNYGSISCQELVTAFELWAKQTVYDQLIEFHGSFSTLFLEKVLQAFRRYCKAKETPGEVQDIPIPEDREKMMINGCMQAWSYYNEKQRILDYGGTRYDFLVKKGIINHSDQRQKEFAIKATDGVELETAFSKSVSGDKKTEAILILSKNLALKAFFDDLIETGTELETIIQ